MFSVGLFSTYLPYVLLAMFYGAYVGVHSIMKMEEDTGLEDDAQKSEEVFHETFAVEDGVDGRGNFHYDQYFLTTESTEPRSEHCLTVSDPPFLPDPIYRSPWYAPIFSRPPPAA